MALETVFSTEASAVVFGPGATREVGPRMRALGCQRVLLVTDPVLAGLESVAIALDSLRKAGIDVEVFSNVRVEPNDASWMEAIAVAQARGAAKVDIADPDLKKQVDAMDKQQ